MKYGQDSTKEFEEFLRERYACTFSSMTALWIMWLVAFIGIFIGLLFIYVQDIWNIFRPVGMILMAYPHKCI